MPITNFDKVELLLPMTGENNGTVFTDYSLRQRAVTRFGDTKTVTAQKAFSAYEGSTYFDGAGDYLSVANDAGLHLGSGDFCIEAQVRFADLPAPGTGRTILGKWAATGNQRSYFLLLFNDSGTLILLFGRTTDGTTNIPEVFPWTPATNTWYRVAIDRNGTSLRCVVDNAQISTTRTISDTIFTSTAPLLIGRQDAAAEFNGWMQDVALTVGASRYADLFPASRMTQRELTRVNTGTDSHEFDRAVLFDFNGGAHTGVSRTVIPDSDGDFEAEDLIDLEYGVAFIKDGCGPVCRGPVEVDPDA
jgi:hypothetical protein